MFVLLMKKTYKSYANTPSAPAVFVNDANCVKISYPYYL